MSSKKESVEIIDGTLLDAQPPISMELSQNSKGYFQMKMKVKSEIFEDAKDYKDIKNKFGKGFVLMQAVLQKEGFLVQPVEQPKPKVVVVPKGDGKK